MTAPTRQGRAAAVRKIPSLFADWYKILPSFIYASEEGEPQKYPVNGVENPEYVVIVDPLDTSELAVRGLHGYTQLIIFSYQFAFSRINLKNALP